MLRIEGERIATPVCALARNDTIFDAFRTNLTAMHHQVCHCEPARRLVWQSASQHPQDAVALVGRQLQNRKLQFIVQIAVKIIRLFQQNCCILFGYVVYF